MWRQKLKEVHDIKPTFELHATEFLSGRGSGGKNSKLTRHKRAQVFHKSFQVIEWLHKEAGVTVFNVANNDDNQFRAFERLLNRIDRTMQSRDSYCHLVCDQGKERQYTQLVRKMRVHNPIPSKYGSWGDGKSSKNLPLQRIIEDPQFKESDKSYFIQLADFVAFGLLRSELPTPKIKRYGTHKSFNQLDKSLEKVCAPNDPRKLGIIR